MRRFEFHFDFRSPYSYLALSQLPSLDAEILYRPFDVLSVMDRVGNVPTSVVCRPKGDYVKRDMRRWAKRYGIPFQPNPAMREADMTRLPRAAIAADRIGAADTAVAALFAALWREPAPLAPRADIFPSPTGAGIDPASQSGRASCRARGWQHV